MVKLLSKSWKKLQYPSKQANFLQVGVKRIAATQRERTYLRWSVSFFTMLSLGLIFYFIAGNIGSGWIYLLSTSMLVALSLGFVLPVIALKGVCASQDTPRQCVAGQAATIKLSLSRTKGWPPLFPIQWLTLSYKLPKYSYTDGSKSTLPYLVECLTEDQCWLWTTPPLARGVYAAGQIVLSTSFPFGLVSWVKEVNAAASSTITVYPKVLPVEGFIFFRLQAVAISQGGLSRSNQAVRQSTSTRGLREYVRGDNPRHVHWASSARAGHLLVREFEAEGLPCFNVFLNLCGPWSSLQQFELAVTTASSLLALGQRLGIGPELMLYPELSQLALDLPPSIPGIALQMEILARVKPYTLPPGAELPTAGFSSQHTQGRVLLAIGPSGHNLVLTSGCYLIEIGAVSSKPEELPCTSSLTGISPSMKSTISQEEDLREL